MNRNLQEIKKVAEMDKLSTLIIMFLMAAMIFVLFMLMSAGLALADPWGRGMGPKYGQRSYGNEDLTPEQSARMEKIYQDYWKEIAPLRQELGIKRAEMRLLDTTSKTEVARIENIRKDIRDLQEKIREKNFNYRFQCQDLLLHMQQDPDSFFGPGRERGSGKGWRNIK